MVKNFPNEGCVDSIDSYLIDYLEETNRTNNYQSSFVNKHEGIAWNENSWWYIKTLMNSKKPFYSIHIINKLINKTNIIEIW